MSASGRGHTLRGPATAPPGIGDRPHSGPGDRPHPGPDDRTRGKKPVRD